MAKRAMRLHCNPAIVEINTKQPLKLAIVEINTKQPFKAGFSI
jgi:hypothetical protein